MIAIYVLLPLSLLVAAGFLAAFIWAVRSGQYEDTCTPAMRMLLDDRKASVSKDSPTGLANKPNPLPPHPEPRSSRRKEAHFFLSTSSQSLLTSAATVHRYHARKLDSENSLPEGEAEPHSNSRPIKGADFSPPDFKPKPNNEK